MSAKDPTRYNITIILNPTLNSNNNSTHKKGKKISIMQTVLNHSESYYFSPYQTKKRRKSYEIRKKFAFDENH